MKLFLSIIFAIASAFLAFLVLRQLLSIQQIAILYFIVFAVYGLGIYFISWKFGSDSDSIVKYAGWYSGSVAIVIFLGTFVYLSC